MLRSGLTVLEALRTLRERCAARQAAAFEALLRRLGEGESLSIAMHNTGGFGATLLACVRSSELSGDLGASLQRYAENAARLRAMRAKLGAALVYPLLLIAVAGLVVAFLLIHVVPRFASVLEGSRQELPMLSRALIATGRALAALPSGVWLALAALLAWGTWQLVRAVREGRVEALMMAAGARAPGLRTLVRGFAHSRFVRSAAMLVRSGIPALKAMTLCGELLHGPDRAALAAAMAQASAGGSLAIALHDHGVVDTLGQRVLRVAEQTGRLDDALDRLADILDQQLERAMERAGRLIEPVLMLGIGLVVGGIVVLMYLPIFQLAANFG